MNFEFRQRKIKPSIIALSICIGLVLGTVFVLLGGYNVLEVYSYLIRGSLGSVSALSSTIRWTTAFLLCGIASGIAFKGGMFNMGTEGQLYMGAISATLVGIYCKGLPAIAHIPLCMLAGMVAGAIWASIPALLRVYWNTSEIVVTLMMNYIAINFTSFLVKEYFLTTGVFGDSLTTDELAATARFPVFGGSPISFGFILGTLLIIAYILFFTKVRISVMLMSGMVAGLAGAAEIMGVQGRFLSGFSPDFGTSGMLVALLGNSSGIGIYISAIFMGILKAGSLTLERSAGVSRALAVVIQALIICFVSVKTLKVFDFKKKEGSGKE